MKVHIALTADVRANPERKQEALATITHAGALKDINMRRFERHGIISAELPSTEAAERVRKLASVQSVSADSVQHALAG